MKNKFTIKIMKEEGFSLPELLVVLVIIGVLVMIAIPIYNNISTRAKMTEAKIMLNQVHTLQQAFYLEYDFYSDNLLRIGFEQNRLITDGGRARYIIEIESADQSSYIATATSIVDFNRSGRFNVWEVNENGVPEQRVAD
jgi:type IV pilus assembly protein PilE